MHSVATHTYTHKHTKKNNNNNKNINNSSNFSWSSTQNSGFFFSTFWFDIFYVNFSFFFRHIGQLATIRIVFIYCSGCRCCCLLYFLLYSMLYGCVEM